MDSETLRLLLLEYLREYSKNPRSDALQWDYIYRGVSIKAKEQISESASPNNDRLRDEDARRLKHVVWDLIIERILVPGTVNPRTINDGWPFLSLTDHGRKVLSSLVPVPYDPDGYLDALRRSVPTISETVVTYLAEAIGTFRTGNFLASAVMLGAASEMVFNELSESLPPVMADTTKRGKLADKMQRGKMKDRIAAVAGWCRINTAHLPGTWSGPEQVEDIEKIADLIRRRRNEAGHPEDPPRCPTREQMYAYLVLFPDYCKHLYVLKDWACSNVGHIS